MTTCDGCGFVYEELPVGEVTTALREAVAAYRDALASEGRAALAAGQLGRRCVYGYPSPGEVDVARVGRHTVHEVLHHLGDVRRVLVDGAG